MKYFPNVFLLILLFVSCQNDSTNENALFVLMDSDHTGVNFENTLHSTIHNNIFEYEYFYNGGGVGAGDFNNDGLTDLFFTGNKVSSKLYLNQGNLSFKDVTHEAGVETKDWCTGVAIVDINQDGWQDIYVCHAGLHQTANQLFVNQGEQPNHSVKFIEKGKDFGIDFKGYTTQAAFFDYDKDGDPDLYLLNHYQSNSNYNFPKVKSKDPKEPSNDRLFRNEGGNRFKDVTEEAGIPMEGFGLGVAIADVNQDGWEDIYVANDFIFDDLLYINNHNGTFSEKAHEYLKHTSRFSMGCDVADINNDIYPDIMVVDMLPDDNKRQKLMSPASNQSIFNFSLERGYLPQYSRNVLQINNGPDPNGKFSFSEIGQLAGVYKTDWSWSPLFGDLDNDGWKDIYVSNGIPKDVTNYDFLKYKHIQNRTFSDPLALQAELLKKLEEMENIDKPDFAFQNNRDLTFIDQTQSWGLSHKGFSNGVVEADLDNDGDLEIVVTNINSKPFIYKNRSNELLKNNFLTIKLAGGYGLGAKIRIVSNGKQQTIEHNVYRGFQSTQDDKVHFGLGKENKIDTLEIIWPDGKYEVKTNIKAGQMLILNYAQASSSAKVAFRNSKNASPLFADITEASGINYEHKENVLEDFNNESLLPHRFSRNGPFLAAGDVDKNGFEDFWIGGSAGFSAQLFLQEPNQKFKIKNLPDREYEDMGALFFDADNDKDLDLYVVSGGNEYFLKKDLYQDRLYLNDGLGNFTRNKTAVPEEFISGSCVTGSDFDQDGDIDLFVGGRLIPTQYPYPAESMILRNDGKGNFVNITSQVCPSLKDLGLVTSAVWGDFDGDGKIDLTVAGEWMPITLFKNSNGIFTKLDQTGIHNEIGWWFSLSSGDFDLDGDIDFVGGNLGLNTKLKASKHEPVSVYAKDFDHNGKIKPVLTYYLNGKEYTIANRDQLSEHLTTIRRKFITYEDFAIATFQEIFPKEELENALVLKATNFNSAYIENLGNGQFAFHPLPVPVQMSVVQNILVSDYDKDGNPDVLLGGNFFSPDYMTGQYDASIGVFLKGDGKGNFNPLSCFESGIKFQGDTRSFLPLKFGNKETIISVANQGKLQVFELNKIYKTEHMMVNK